MSTTLHTHLREALREGHTLSLLPEEAMEQKHVCHQRVKAGRAQTHPSPCHSPVEGMTLRDSEATRLREHHALK